MKLDILRLFRCAWIGLTLFSFVTFGAHTHCIQILKFCHACMFVAGARKRIYGFCIESVGLFVHHLIVLFRDFGNQIGLLLFVQKSSEHLVLRAG